ncbi:16S rRNA (adenine(1518)-N(6)/adenine(1519)-N(6))-dimethyltransferase RsmA [Vacuolonema iberomarrocanum]|uniref:16S rRNA (adenine(1518)-N(6)/adenine(1519)-N(6))- dimethyltransferase RsmA n=1 Tax=Vacuolonema iberomarrocanum TaxID=3454632 RepID=UPI0019E7DB02|nr:16S rRNA (adenine(1518)-N(6)/adenine(1519)-N(6))-dimethyltransferase RsmA [filamentous cyanobacterium LEGE 07170]
MAPRPRKRFAQHWLRSEKALQQIVLAAELSGGKALLRPEAETESAVGRKGDRVLEIGPGTGLLTQRLLRLAETVVAVEIDRDLTQLLRQELGDVENFLLIEADFLSLDLAAALADFPAFQAPNKVVANIPYNITGPILEKLLGTITQPNPTPFDSLVLLVQKEVAERLCAAPGRKAFGALSVRVQYLAECEWIGLVPAKAFQPPPKVDSAVVRLKPRKFLPAAQQPRHMDQLVRLGFASRRKMLRNNLKGLLNAEADSGEGESIPETLQRLGLNPQARAEELGVGDWVALSNDLLARGKTAQMPPEVG